MKYGVQIFLAVILTIVPLYESAAASIDDLLGRTHLEIKPLFTYRLQYEDNIDADKDGADRLSDWSNQYRPEIELNAYSTRVSLNTGVKLNIVEYINERDFNYVDQDYTMSLGFLPNERLEFSVGAGYSVNTDTNRVYEEGDPADLDGDYSRYKDKTWEYNGGFSYVLSPRSSIGVNGFYSDYDTITTNGSKLWGLMGSYTYNLSARTNALLNAGYFHYDFKGNNQNLDPDDPNYFYSYFDYTIKNYNLTAGIEHEFANESKFLVQGGFRYTEQDTTAKAPTGTQKDSGNGNGWVADIQWQRTWTDWMQAFEAHHDINISPEGSSYDSTVFISRTRHDINRRCSVNLVLRAKRAYADGDEFAVDRDVRYYTVNPYVGYKLYRWLTATIGYQFRYNDYKKRSNYTSHSNIFYIDLKFIPLRSLIVR